MVQLGWHMKLTITSSNTLCKAQAKMYLPVDSTHVYGSTDEHQVCSRCRDSVGCKKWSLTSGHCGPWKRRNAYVNWMQWDNFQREWARRGVRSQAQSGCSRALILVFREWWREPLQRGDKHSGESECPVWGTTQTSGRKDTVGSAHALGNQQEPEWLEEARVTGKFSLKRLVHAERCPCALRPSTLSLEERQLNKSQRLLLHFWKTLGGFSLNLDKIFLLCSHQL